MKTLPAAFIKNADKRMGNPFLFYKEEGQWRTVSWNEVAETVKYLTLGLLELGVKKGDRISAISETRPEMAYACLAVAASGAIFAPIYHTNSPGECAHILKDSGAGIAYAEDEVQLEKLKVVWDECPALERIIVHKMSAPQKDPRIMSLDQLIAVGKEAFVKNGDKAYHDRIASVAPEDLSAIIYTSGTTGPPKGVMDTNEGIINNMKMLEDFFPVSEHSRGISALPMAHGIELMNGHWYHVYYGFPQIYAQSIRTIYDDLCEMHPTFFFIPPRFYEKVYNEMMAFFEACPPWKRNLYQRCLEVGTRYQDMKEKNENGTVPPSLQRANDFAKVILFSTVRGKMGGKMEWASSGGAPIQTKILNFFRACGLGVYEGFGLTESQGLIALNRPGAWKVGTVGKPSKGLELKFDEDGEILVKGWARSEGYWNNPEATDELFAEGWLHTGDIGYLDEDGFLNISGRKKELIITSSGKNISPANIQVLLETSPYISQTVVFGEGKTYLTALVTLDEEMITEYARDHDLSFSDFADLTRHPAISELIDNEIRVKNRELARIEQVKEFKILDDQFRQDRGEVTPTMKLKRNVIEKQYREVIAGMYAQKAAS